MRWSIILALNLNLDPNSDSASVSFEDFPFVSPWHGLIYNPKFFFTVYYYSWERRAKTRGKGEWVVWKGRERQGKGSCLQTWKWWWIICVAWLLGNFMSVCSVYVSLSLWIRSWCFVFCLCLRVFRMEKREKKERGISLNCIKCDV